MGHPVDDPLDLRAAEKRALLFIGHGVDMKLVTAQKNLPVLYDKKVSAHYEIFKSHLRSFLASQTRLKVNLSYQEVYKDVKRKSDKSRAGNFVWIN